MRYFKTSKSQLCHTHRIHVWIICLHYLQNGRPHSRGNVGKYSLHGSWILWDRTVCIYIYKIRNLNPHGQQAYVAGKPAYYCRWSNRSSSEMGNPTEIKRMCSDSPHTWRIIPRPRLGSVVNNHGDRKSPEDRVVGPLPNGLTGL